mgnify:FL=1
MISVQRFEDLIVPRLLWFDFSEKRGISFSSSTNEKKGKRTVGGVFVEHKGVAGLDLSLEDGVPKLLSGDDLLRATLLLVLVEQRTELVAVDLVKSRSFGGAEEGPVTRLLDALHEEVGDPEGEEEVARANLLLAVVLAEVEELEDVGVPRLEVDGERSGSLVSTLVDVARRVVVDAKHGDDAIGVAVRACDVRARRADVVNAESDPASRLGDESASLERVVDAFDRVVFHRHEEARRELRMRSTGVEESRGGVGEEALRHEVVRLKDAVDVAAVDTDGDAHEHVLRALSDLAVDAEEVGSLEGLEAKVVLQECGRLARTRVESSRVVRT